jgi:hypothetical protein
MYFVNNVSQLLAGAIVTMDFPRSRNYVWYPDGRPPVRPK